MKDASPAARFWAEFRESRIQPGGFAELLLEVAGGGSLREQPFPPERAQIDVGSVYADYGKIRERLGWEPHVGLRKGLGRMVDYYRRNREHYW